MEGTKVFTCLSIRDCDARNLVEVSLEQQKTGLVLLHSWCKRIVEGLSLGGAGMILRVILPLEPWTLPCDLH